eukprot:TRINITY_DN9411_c0_g1_i1.p1 TRINITY_DN9411_c0_g1~~TRINITY_DN9411_c0_g1_i1.p1  ORF type:complete len:462 (+),score=12.88 TRINITY_DN9411_c0_g1_i1:129-1514(+)
MITFLFALFAGASCDLTRDEGIMPYPLRLRRAASAQYSCIVTVPPNAPSIPCAEGSSVVEDDDRCTPRCNDGFKPSDEALDCNTGSLSPPTFSCLRTECPVTCASALGASCVAGGSILSEGTATTSIAVGDSVGCLNSATSVPVLAAVAGVVCDESATPIEVSCIGALDIDSIAPNGNASSLTSSEVATLVGPLVQALQAGGGDATVILDTVGNVLADVDVPFARPALCFGQCTTACAGGTAYACIGCLSCLRSGERQTDTAVSTSLVICNQASAEMQRSCYEQAVCAGILTRFDSCTVDGVGESCPACGGSSSDPGSEESSDNSLLVLLLLLIIPVCFCLCCLVLFLCFVARRRTKRRYSSPAAEHTLSLFGSPSEAAQAPEDGRLPSLRPCEFLPESSDFVPPPPPEEDLWDWDLPDLRPRGMPFSAQPPEWSMFIPPPPYHQRYSFPQQRYADDPLWV